MRLIYMTLEVVRPGETPIAIEKSAMSFPRVDSIDWIRHKP